MEVKVTLVYTDSEKKIARESIWATPLEDGNYEVNNVPFFAPNLANRDVIGVKEQNGILYYDDLIEESGHSTVQVIFFNEAEDKRVLKKLEEFNCFWEGMKNMPYFAIDVPVDTDYKLVKGFLDSEAGKKVLDYKEACLSDKHRRQL